MTIKPVCDSCKRELDDFGAILFGPPDSQNQVKKYHICKDCFEKIKKENIN
jgi:hypothetical protein